MITKTKLSRLIKQLNEFIALLERNNGQHLQQHISTLYYIKKRDELQRMLSDLEEGEISLERMAHLFDEQYRIIFRQWWKDMRALSACRRNHTSKPVL